MTTKIVRRVLAAGTAVFFLLSAARAETVRTAEPSELSGPPSASQGPRAESAHPEKGRKRWLASCLALAALNMLDIHSSRGHVEANPLLRNSSGRFAAGKAALLKSAITGGFFAAQLWIMRAHPEKDYYKSFTLANTVAAAAMGGVAAHNYSLPPPRPRAVLSPLPAHLAPEP